MAYIKSFKGQNWLLPPNIEELIPEDHVCFLVESFIDSLDFSNFDVKYSGAGAPAYHPKVILKSLVMGVLDKVRSSRRVARNIRENVVYMYLAERLSPDFRTISDFRKNNPNLIKETFTHTVTLSRQEGLLDLSHLSTDGSKLKSNSSNGRTLTKKELEFLLKFIDIELEKWAKQDELEDDFFGKVRGSDQLPEKSKKKMKKAVQRYIKEQKNGTLKKEVKEKLYSAKDELDKHNLKKVSVTDPESRFMRPKHGKFRLSYNCEITSEKNGFILASDVCKDANDINQLEPQVLQTEKNLSGIPENLVWSFDNGYYESGNIKFLADKNIDAYIPNQMKKNISPYNKSKFIYDLNQDEYTCPKNKKVTFLSVRLDKPKNKLMRFYRCLECRKCLKQKECTTRKDGIRHLKVYPHEIERMMLDAKMKTNRAKEIYKKRKQIVEPVFGDIKENKEFTKFLTRGLETVKIEFNLLCTASNLNRIQVRKIRKKKECAGNRLYPFWVAT